MSATRLAAVLLLGLVASVPAHAATVAVAPIRDAGKHGEGDALRKQIEHGLSEAGVKVVGANTLASLAKRQGLLPSDLAKPAVLIPLAQSSGADSVLAATLKNKGHKEQVLLVRVFDLSAVELWSREIKLVKGKLPADVPKKIGRAANAAVDAAKTSKPQEPASAPAVESPTEPATPPSSTQAAPPPLTPAEPRAPEKTEPAPRPSASDDDHLDEPAPPKLVEAPARPTPAKSEKPHRTLEQTGELPPQVERGPAPPIISVGLGAALMLRSYRVCPGVKSCSEPGPDPTPAGLDTPVSYNTSSPGGGVVLHAELFPAPRLVKISDSLTFTAGVVAELMRSLSVTNGYKDPVTGTEGHFSSYLQRLDADLAARLYFRMLNGTGHGGLFLGYLGSTFHADQNPVLLESSRHGLAVGASTEIPIAGDYVRFSGSLGLAPSANPGVNETTAYGTTGAGSGLLVRGGLSGSYQYLGYAAYADFARYTDTFTGAGAATTNGAVSEETYTTFFVMLNGRF